MPQSISLEPASSSPTRSIFFRTFPPLDVSHKLERITSFRGRNFRRVAFQVLNRVDLARIIDLRQAEYSDLELCQIHDLSELPTNEDIYAFLNQCSRCGAHDH